jgi:DNA primase
MNSDVEEIKNRLSIVDVLGGYIRLEKAGVNFRARCPFHNEKTPSFVVSEEKQIWHCFGCQKGGDIFKFVMEMEGLEFKEALKLLAEKAGVELKRFDGKTEAKKNRIFEILELTTKFYEYQLWEGPGKNKILSYLRERGIKDETIKNFRLGYAPKGWENILNFLVSRGYSVEEIERAGLLVKKTNNQQPTTNNVVGGKLSVVSSFYDRFRERIMFPIADTNGKVVGYSARVTPGQDEKQAKYINTPETEVYHKSKILYGIDKAKNETKQQNFVLLVEGNLDVIAASQAGIKNVVAVSGTALTPEHLRIIKRYANKVKLCFDMDKAGEAATKKSLKLCFKEEVAADVVELPSGKDAAELSKNNPDEMKKAVEKSEDAMAYYLRKNLSKYDKKEVDGKNRIAEELLDMIGSLTNELSKSHWIKKLSEALETKENVLTDMLKKASIKNTIGKTSSSGGTINAETFSPKSKEETLIQEMIGLMLVYAEVWEKAVAEEQENPIFQKNVLLNFIEKNGERLNFSFDNLLKFLEDETLKNQAEKIFFEKKYQFDLNNNVEEIIVKEPVVEFSRLLAEIKREEQRMLLEKIERDLKIAEEKKDKDAMLFLRQEASRISQEIK